MFLKAFKNKSVMRSWIFAILILLFFNLTIGWIYYVVSFRALTDEVANSNALRIAQIYDSVDGAIKNMISLSVKISMDEKITSLGKIDSAGITAENIYNFRTVTGDLNNYAFLTPEVDGVYLYLPKIDRIINQTVVLDSKTFYEAEYENNADITYEDWMNMLVSAQKTSIIAQKSAANPRGEVAVISAPLLTSQPDVLIVIKADIGKFYDTSYDDMRFNGDLYIFDADDRLMYTDSASPVIFTMEENINDFDAFDLKLDGKSYIASAMESFSTRLKYVTVIETSYYLRTINYVRNISILFLLLYLIVGGCLAVWVIKRNYSPLKALVSQLNEASKFLDFEPAHNEFEYLESVIKNLFDKNKNMGEELDYAQDALMENLKFDLIRGNIGNIEAKQKKLKDVGISFIGDKFHTVLFNFSNLQKLFAEDVNMTFERRNALSVFILDNVLCELCEPMGKCFTLRLESNRCVAIINLREDNPCETDALEHMLNTCLDFLSEKLGMDIICTLSGRHSGIANISNAYKESVVTMSYRIAFINQRVIPYEKVASTFSAEIHYKYTIEDEAKLISLVKTGDRENAARLLQSILDENLSDNVYPMPIVRCLIFDIISTMLKLSTDVLKGFNAKILDLAPKIEELMGLEDINEIRATLLYILNQVCEFIHIHENRQLKTKVMEYVNDNYNDFNLSVNLVAADLGFSVGYLSTAFKEQAGENLSDYINKLRVDISKKHLANKSFSIEKIAAEVGYSNSRAYVRAFSRHCGITPAKYRKLTGN